MVGFDMALTFFDGILFHFYGIHIFSTYTFTQKICYNSKNAFKENEITYITKQMSLILAPQKMILSLCRYITLHHYDDSFAPMTLSVSMTICSYT